MLSDYTTSYIYSNFYNDHYDPAWYGGVVAEGYKIETDFWCSCAL